MNDFAILQYAKDVMAREAYTIVDAANQLNESFSYAVRLILRQCGTPRVITSGIGKSGLIARKTSAMFAAIGFESFFIHPTEAMHGDLGSIQPGSVIILFSHSGETEEVVRLAEHLCNRETMKIIAITSSADSSLGQLADVTIPLDSQIHEADHLRMLPTSSAAAMHAISDALAVTLARLRNLTIKQFNQNHPGGPLGQKSKEQLI